MNEAADHQRSLTGLTAGNLISTVNMKESKIQFSMSACLLCFFAVLQQTRIPWECIYPQCKAAERDTYLHILFIHPRFSFQAQLPASVPPCMESVSLLGPFCSSSLPSKITRFPIWYETKRFPQRFRMLLIQMHFPGSPEIKHCTSHWEDECKEDFTQ